MFSLLEKNASKITTTLKSDSLVWFVADAAHLVSKRAWKMEAMPIAIANSASSCAQYWNHSCQASPTCFPYTIDVMKCRTLP